MSLILTSCTMGKQPERLLNKGPQYLRTRSTSGLFVQGKKSATELLAESKSQFYSSRSTVDLSQQQDLAVSVGQGQRYRYTKKAEPPRSKSQYDLTQIHLTSVDDNSDENNNNASDDSNDDCLDGSYLHTSHKPSIGGSTGPTHSVDEAAAVVSQPVLQKEAANFVSASVFRVDNVVKPNQKLQPELTILRSGGSVAYVHEQKQEVPKNGNASAEGSSDALIPKKPMPAPRKSIVKPVPLPRKLSLRSPGFESKNSSSTCLTKVLSSSFSLQNLSPSSTYLVEETTQLKTQTSVADIYAQKKHSLIESRTRCSSIDTSECAHLPPQDSLPSPNDVKTYEEKSQVENAQIHTAKPIVKTKPDIHVQKLISRTISIVENGPSIQLPDTNSPSAVPNVSSNGVDPSRSRTPHRKASTSSCATQKRIDSNITKLDGSPTIVDSRFISVDKSSVLLPSSRLEMSIESVDQAVYESEISAIPSVSMEASDTHEEDRESREITRSNSSLSGKFEQQSASPISLSPTPHCSSVPRSYSDISCHLEGQHSRDSSIVSNHSRLSRASIGTDLENFFNQMGMEKGVLEPIGRLKELHGPEIFDSMSSLDSHDAASICSTYSRSDQEWSDTQSMDRNLQQTSIVERNARIIKWLCNVRKAKSPSQKAESATASNA